MIPELTFPLTDIQLTPLYRDHATLMALRAASTAPGALSKVAAAYHELYFPAPPADRPYTFASMVLSLDGKMAFPDDPQGPLVAAANAIDPRGGLADFWVLNVLRAHADAIIVGAKTLQSEPQVVCACFDPDLVRERASQLGKTAACPLNVIVSLDGTDVPLTHPLFAVPEIETVIASGGRGGAFLAAQLGAAACVIGPFCRRDEIDPVQVDAALRAGLAAGQRVLLLTGAVDPDAALLLYLLRLLGIEDLLIESPTYTWLLMRDGLLDEFFVNYSSLLIGGPLTPGATLPFTSHSHPHTRFLVAALHRDSFLFTRQQIVYGLTRG